ncbi:MAG: dihydropteroate synthase [Saprospiraceae bacterium]
MIDTQLTLNCNGQLLVLHQAKVMGILNITPDSFYAASRANNLGESLERAEQMLSEGATLLDVGGMSSRPGATVISSEEETRRVVPIVSAIKKHFPEAIISVDTVHSQVAKACVEVGAGIVNDISAGRLDPLMYPTIAELQVPYVLMHMKGEPHSMQDHPVYTDVVQEVMDFFIEETGKLRALGIIDIIIDPGFGFGKTLEHNYTLLKNLHLFQIMGRPVLTGLSRKSMIYNLLNTKPDEALTGTTALHMVALQQGSKILRTHDVKPAIEVIKLWNQLENP